MIEFIRSAERVATHPTENFVFQRSLLAYQQAAELVSGNVLEIGTGSGYGVSLIAPRSDEFWTIDKNCIDLDYNTYRNTRFICKEVPLLSGLPDAYFDCVISFQVIEHIKDDSLMIKEIHRVLKPGGKLIMSTPNQLKSLTRNPWHIREYTMEQFRILLSDKFTIKETLGVFGNEKVETYYEKNKLSVAKFLMFDIFNLNKRLPIGLLRIPYDIANHLNRILLFRQNKDLTQSILTDDYFFKEADEHCYDLFYIALRTS